MFSQYRGWIKSSLYTTALEITVRAPVLFLWLFFSRLNIPRNFIHSSSEYFLISFAVLLPLLSLSSAWSMPFLTWWNQDWEKQDLLAKWYHGPHPHSTPTLDVFNHENTQWGCMWFLKWVHYFTTWLMKGKTLIVMNRVSMSIKIKINL